jgi:hypothetical protein
VEFDDGVALVSVDGDTTRYWDVESGEPVEETKKGLEVNVFTFSKGSSRGRRSTSSSSL